MGYYTLFSIKHDSSSFALDKVIHDALQKIDDGYNPFEDRTKWYNHEEDMKSCSKQFPTTVFTLSGTGEESGDIWKKYFKNGEMQVAKANITFEECKF
jgi:hypothetical protein